MTTIDIGALRAAVGLRDVEAADAARARLDTLVKPVGSLGRLEQLAVKITQQQMHTQGFARAVQIAAAPTKNIKRLLLAPNDR